MNATTYQLTSVTPLAAVVAKGVAVSPVTASVEPELALSGATKTGTKARGHEPADTAILAKAFRCSRAARRDERNGFPCTAAMEWRHAAELFAPNPRAVEYCWREWERIMHLPRRLAGPASVSPPGRNVIDSQKASVTRRNVARHHVDAMLAACGRVISKARLCDRIRRGVRLGKETAMAIVIVYYVPEKFRKQSEKWIPPEQRGKIIPFPALEQKKSA